MSASGNTPYRLTRPHVGFNPVIPFAADGSRMEPPVSDPSVPQASPAAVATPEPEEDEPVQYSAPHGLSGAGTDG